MSLSNYKSLITAEIQGRKKIDMNRKEKAKPPKSLVFMGFGMETKTTKNKTKKRKKTKRKCKKRNAKNENKTT